jgi:NAD+ synthase (glutamine-hydrolysing)
MHIDLKKELEKIRNEIRKFNVDLWIDKKTDMLNDYMKKFGLKACLVNVSGGVDSAVTLALMLHASKKPNSPIKKVLGIAQPIASTENIWKRALECGKVLGAEVITIDQTDIHYSLVNKVENAIKIKGGIFANGQLRSYMRTPVAFYVAQLITQEGLPCIVLGTGNYDEDGYLFYFCKAGDGVADIQLIADLHKSEVFKVAEKLGVPKSILTAPPSADLWEGQTDENELGFNYDFIELYTEYLKFSEDEKRKFQERICKEAWNEFITIAEKANQIHKKNSHKAHFPLNLNILE